MRTAGGNKTMQVGVSVSKPQLISSLARIAGLLYLIEIVTGLFSIMYVPAQIRVHGDASATVQNLMAHEVLFRLSVVAESISGVVALILPLVLYKLLRPVNRNAAMLMAAFGVVMVPISFIGIANELNILSLLNDNSAQQHALASDQLVVQITTLFKAEDNNTLASIIFWGLWLLPFGYLVWKSGFLPKSLGFFLMLGCFGYLILFFANVLFPSYRISNVVILPAMIGEIGIALWLALVGVRKPVAVS
jgi:hypothetical protein